MALSVSLFIARIVVLILLGGGLWRGRRFFLFLLWMARSVLLDALELQRIGDTVGEPLSQLPPHLGDDGLPCLLEDGFVRRLVGVC